MIKGFFILFLVFLCWFKSHAQGSATGCLLADSKVYTSAPILGMYDSGTFVGLSSNYCTWTPSSGVPCRVCFNGLINIAGLCIGIGAYTSSGQANTFTMVECPMDDYAWTITLAFGILGFVVIRRRFT